MLICSVAVSKASRVGMDASLGHRARATRAACDHRRMRRNVHSRLLLALAALLLALHVGAAPRVLSKEVEAALEEAKVPGDAIVALVQEVGAPSSRLSWQAQQPVNPASLMKLLTTGA